MPVELKKTVDNVKELLQNYPQTRDSDDKLLAIYWSFEYRKLDNDMNNFLIRLHSGELTSSESIRRCRQALQAKYPELRGEKYNKRLERQSKIKEELKEI